MSVPNVSSEIGSVLAGAPDWASVRDWPLQGLKDAEDALSKRIASLQEHAATVAEHTGSLRSSWSGTAAEAAHALIGAHVEHTNSLTGSARTALGALREYRSGAEALRAKAQEIDNAAASHAMTVASDGSLSSAAGKPVGLYAKSVAQKLAVRAAEVLAQTTLLDRKFAEVLASAQWAEGKADGKLELATKYNGKLTPGQLEGELKKDATYFAQLLTWTDPPPEPSSEAAQDTQRFLRHPDELDAKVNERVGELSGLEGKDLSARDMFGQLAQLYPDDGGFALAPGPQSLSVPPPRTIEQLVSPPTADSGQRDPNIQVRRIDGADGKASYVLNLSGQRVDNTPDQALSTDLNDLGVSLRGLSGQETWYQRAAEQALLQAGATPADPVLIAGNSQGGIIAAEAAADWVREGKFNVTHVITGIAPNGLVDMPSGIKVLSVENQYDIVSRLDGLPNPVTRNWTTFETDRQTDSMGNHNPGDAFQQLSDPANSVASNPQVRAFEESLARSGYTTGTNVESTAYLATRHLAADAKPS